MKCDTYCCHDDHPFIYKLSIEEKKYIQKTAHSHIYMNKQLKKKDLIKLNELLIKLNDHFSKNPTKHYFLRLNKLSPKDAFYHMSNMINNENINDDYITTIDDIKRDLDVLHVGIPVNKLGEYCIEVILNSDRVYCELAFNDESEDISILLLDYININHKNETRCYVKENKLIAMSQYYCDLTNVYNDAKQVPILIKNFFENKGINTDLASYVFDVYIDDDNKVKIIELNSYNHATDSCLFTWEELDIEPFEYRYKNNNIIEKITISNNNN